MVLLETGRLDESDEHFAKAVELEPQKGLTNYYCAEVMYGKGKLTEAVLYYQRALEQDPEYVPALLNLASIRATGVRPDLRNVDEAFALVTKACEVTRYEDPDVLKSLAGVYASAGQFDQAVNAARKALQIARAAEKQDLAEGIERTLEVYRRLQAQNRK